jgi:hypothetical protein
LNQISVTIIVAWVAVAGFAGMLCFQIALAMGMPWGNLAWGGKHKILPNKLRFASLISALIFVFGAICIMEKANIFVFLNLSIIADIFIWILVCIFGLSILGNILSSSRQEKHVMTPVAVILFLTCLAVVIEL